MAGNVLLGNSKIMGHSSCLPTRPLPEAVLGTKLNSNYIKLTSLDLLHKVRLSV